MSAGVPRRTLACLAAAAIALLCGCATTVPLPPSSQEVRDNLGVVAIVPAAYTPRSNFLISPLHKAGAAGKQAALAATGGTVGTVVMNSAWLGPFGLLAGVLVTGTMAVREAMVTAKGIVPAETAAQIESAIGEAVVGLDVQHELATRLTALVNADPSTRLAAAGTVRPGTPDEHVDYAPLRTTGVDSVIEIGITEIGFDGCISRDAECHLPYVIHLYMRSQSRLVRVTDGAVLLERQHEYKSGNHDLAYWLTDGGRSLKEEFEQAYRASAESIHDEVFLIAPIELPYVYNSWQTHCWLEPVYPEVRVFKVHSVDTLQPTLRWTAFPRDIDRRELAPSLLQRVDNVTYDLRIWDESVEVRNRGPDERWRSRIVYERTGLEAPQHTLEVPLRPDSRYYWAMRARFVVDGKSMATRWARWLKCFSDEVSLGYYEFDTPE